MPWCVTMIFFGPRPKASINIRYVMFFPLKVIYTLLIITGGLESFQYPLFLTASMKTGRLPKRKGSFRFYVLLVSGRVAGSYQGV